MKKRLLYACCFLLVTRLLAQTNPCQDSLNHVLIELNKKRTLETAWEKDRKDWLDSLQSYQKLKMQYDTLALNHESFKKRVTDVGGVDTGMYRKFTEKMNESDGALKKAQQEIHEALHQKNLLENMLKNSQTEAETLKKDTAHWAVRCRQAEAEKEQEKLNVAQKITENQKLVEQHQLKMKVLSDEDRDRIVSKSFESKTGLKFNTGIYFFNKNKTFAPDAQDYCFVPFETRIIRLPIALDKEKNKIVMSDTNQYKLNRICKLLYRHISNHSLKLKVTYASQLPHLPQMNPKKSAEYAVSELLNWLKTDFDYISDESKIEIKYIDYAPEKLANEPFKGWIDVCIDN